MLTDGQREDADALGVGARWSLCSAVRMRIIRRAEGRSNTKVIAREQSPRQSVS
ncbi:hypothetical protein I546_4936 [Mycobacterium kansasii 732]|nr:hypothetical protein I546_4936 [Mycobacterium kansasii 732]